VAVKPPFQAQVPNSLFCNTPQEMMRPEEIRDRFTEKAEWFDRHYDSARGRVRFRVLQEQLRRELPAPPARILDAGCGPGRMAAALTADGHRLTLLDPNEAMLEHAKAAIAPHAGGSRVLCGMVEEAPEIFGQETFDVVLLHAVVCYVQDLDAALGAAAAVLKPGGVLSILFKNHAALPFKHAADGRFEEALRVLDDPLDTGKLGITNQARSRQEVEEASARRGLRPRKAYGVRAFADLVPEEPSGADLERLVSLELNACEREPYRSVSRMLHLVCEHD
jgi:S-adenosylmethionine-dependent methyltransferase